VYTYVLNTIFNLFYRFVPDGMDECVFCLQVGLHKSSLKDFCGLYQNFGIELCSQLAIGGFEIIAEGKDYEKYSCCVDSVRTFGRQQKGRLNKNQNLFNNTGVNNFCV